MANSFYGESGYKNPLGGGDAFKPPGSLGDFTSWKKDIDWKGAGGGTDWKQQPGVDKSGLWEKSFGQYSDPEQRYLNKTKKNLFSKAGARKKDKEQEDSSGFGATIGKGTEGGGQQIFSDFGAIMPSQHAPVVVQGTPGQKGLFSQIAGIAAPVVGLMGGPTAPFISAGLSGLSETDW